MRRLALTLTVVSLLAVAVLYAPTTLSMERRPGPMSYLKPGADLPQPFAGRLAPPAEAWLLSPATVRPAEGAVPLRSRGVWWVFFNNKNPLGQTAIEAAMQDLAGSLAARSRDRRLRMTGTLALDARDLPVYPAYIEALRGTGARVRGASRWLNAASVLATPEELFAISNLPFVKSVQAVATFRRKPVTAVRPAMEEKGKISSQAPAADPAYYNRTYDQLQELNVPAVHDLGYTGAGVLICMLDTGYNLRHEALIDLDVVAERDFVQGDGVTSNQPGDYPTQHNHGTITMSTIGGYKPGEFVGGAPDAQFALAKTEIVDQEIQIEEDLYVMGLEWGDSLGASIVSSSLGYLDWYTYADMDGQTAITTNAVDIAASKGITVVTAMGNEQANPWHYLIAPADADTVISVGAVDSNGDLTGFSSVGPTYDGRIKPDVVARGLSTSAVSPTDSTGYVLSAGTSLSTPLIAASAALICQAHSDWGPVEIRNALRFSADQAFSPDTARGWGLPDVLAAIGMGTADAPPSAPALSAYGLPNPFRTRLTLHFTVGEKSGTYPGAGAQVVVSAYDAAGRLVRTLFDGHLPPGPHSIEWDGHDFMGRQVPSGVYMMRVVQAEGVSVAKTLLIR